MLRMPLGSGLYGMDQPDPNLMMLTGQSPISPLGLKPPTMPLGSGMYDSSPSDSSGPFQLGSGLYGQQMPAPNIQNGQAPAGGQNSTQAGGDRFLNMLNNPMFQIGMTLLGNSNKPNPFADMLPQVMNMQRQKALADLEAKRVANETRGVDINQKRVEAAIQNEQAMRDLAQNKFGFEQQQYNEAAPLRGAQLANANAQTGLLGAQTGRLGSETQMDQQKLLMAKQQMQRQNAILDQIGSSGLFGATDAANTTPGGTGQTGKYGTPTWLLDGLQRTESGGNPTARGPTLPDGTQAQGAFQFTPATVKTLAAQGFNFNPDDPGQARDAADYYIQQLAKRNGGDYAKALAAYGGFVTKDPSQYIAKVTGGMPLPGQGGPVQGATPTQNPSMTGDKGMRAIQMGALAGLAGVPGAQGLVEAGKAMQPVVRQPNTYIQDPTNGQTTFMPDQYKERELGMQQAKTGQEVQNQEAARNEKQAQAKQTYSQIAGSLDQASQKVDELLKHPGLSANTGLSGALNLPKYMPGSDAKDASIMLDNLKSKLRIDLLKDLKTEGKNGSSGLGQLSDKEGQVLETYLENLDRAQSEPAMRKALGNLQTFFQQSKGRFTDTYNTLYGNPNSPNVSAAQGAQPARTTPKVGDVDGGYRFKGGNPGDPNAWEKAQ